MKIHLIWAQDQNGGIGKDRKLPWHIPEDLQFFKQLTSGHPVIMGRKTFESIGHPLPNRLNVIISTSLKTAPEGTLLLTSIDSLKWIPNVQVYVDPTIQMVQRNSNLVLEKKFLL